MGRRHRSKINRHPSLAAQVHDLLRVLLRDSRPQIRTSIQASKLLSNGHSKPLDQRIRNARLLNLSR